MRIDRFTAGACPERQNLGFPVEFDEDQVADERVAFKLGLDLVVEDRETQLQLAVGKSNFINRVTLLAVDQGGAPAGVILVQLKGRF